MNNSDVFRKITAALDAASIAYMLAGSFASSFYGASRSTLDIDFVIEATPQKLRLLVEHLPQNEYYVELDAALDAHKHESLFNILDIATGWKIDLIMLKSNAFGQEEFRRRKHAMIDGIQLFIVSAEDAILSKLEWSKIGGSHRQLEDVAGIVRVRAESLDHSYLSKWIKELGLENQWNEARQLAGISETI
jgi:hypothetical protein